MAQATGQILHYKIKANNNTHSEVEETICSYYKNCTNTGLLCCVQQTKPSYADPITSESIESRNTSSIQFDPITTDMKYTGMARDM